MADREPRRILTPMLRASRLGALALSAALLGAFAAAPTSASAEELRAPKTTRPAKGKAKKAAKAQRAKDDPEFAKRFAALVDEKKLKPVAVVMKPSDDPDILPESFTAGMVLVAHGRTGIYTPPILSPDDILGVVNAEMKTIRRCYKAQLEADPEWSDELILDLSVKKTGRVSEVSISPRRVARAEIGRCLMAEIPKWKFPSFTGELDEGVTQEVVSASFPFSFNHN